MLSDLGAGFAAFADPTLILLAVAGVVLGTLVGVLPGIGPIGAMSVLLGVTTQVGPTGSLILFAGIYFGSTYGGSTTSILLNIPGEASSVVTALDGNQMTKKGRSGPALTIAAVSSFVAGTLSILGLMLFAPSLSAYAVKLGPPEYMALCVAGLVLLASLSQGSTARAMVMICLGLAVGTVGIDPAGGELRFTFGSTTLAQGFSFIALVMGVFGIAEALTMAGPQRHAEPVRAPTMRELLPNRTEAREAAPAALRGSFIGFFLGLVPGPAAVLSTFASYVVERKVSRHPERFGHGAVEGVAGPEAANNAAAGAAFIPLMVLGIPFAPTMALVLAALLLNGIVPGPTFIADQPELFWTVIAAMYIGNLMLLVLNLPLVGLFTRLLAVPPQAMMPLIIGLCTIGVYADGNSVFDVVVMLGAGLLGYLLRTSGFSMAAFVLAVVLQPTLESSLRQTLAYSSGDPTYVLGRPITLVVFAVVLVAVATMARAGWVARRARMTAPVDVEQRSTS
ncbi:tripartite tricarboxylate transporter permease [Nocardioides hwasunensis]|uniref:Tripartite tricarboxylate transporter permease n=1 Tax=Nocardioides hwasunensis TaxID=397258 RepID=A0ABR8MLC7_9ACTN|nr:tripartite tricarboxylate transporter permease [Nocardioides hwasunensis]MBD3916375.1 tripartite tricarboxylate transporter permease [Nocardioides hwasunensis]